MAATLISATGVFGFAAQETTLGVIIHGIEEDSAAEWKYQTDNQGARTGVSCYDERIEAKITGEMMATNGYAGKLAGNITLANAISTGHLNASNSGRTLVKSTKLTRSNEDWAKIEISAEVLPAFS